MLERAKSYRILWLQTSGNCFVQVKIKPYIAAQFEMTILFAQELRFFDLILCFNQRSMLDFLFFLLFGFFVEVHNVVVFFFLLIGIAYF